MVTMTTRLAFSGLLITGSLAVLAPVSFTTTSGIAPATADCATCCPQVNATCVICGEEKCTGFAGYYEGKIGPNGCQADQET